MSCRLSVSQLCLGIARLNISSNLGRTQPRPFEKLCRYRLDGPPILSAQGSGLLFQPLNTLIIVRKSMLNEKVGGIAKCPTPTSGCGASS